MQRSSLRLSPLASSAWGPQLLTAPPGDQFSGKVDLLAATKGEHDATGYFSIPIISHLS